MARLAGVPCGSCEQDLGHGEFVVSRDSVWIEANLGMFVRSVESYMIVQLRVCKPVIDFSMINHE